MNKWQPGYILRVMNMKPVLRSRGFTLVEIMIVVGIIGLLASMAIPTFMVARTSSQRKACINNLRQIDAAKQQWALETRQGTNSTPVFTVLRDYLRGEVVCPAGGLAFSDSYTINPLMTKPECVKKPTDHLAPTDTTN
jgi:prepilin-type N-terminal cleavage/methylation domain-containing protein